MTRRRALAGLAVAALGGGLWIAGDGAWIYGKAVAAQILLDRAWARARAGAVEARPWPWADTWPVARLAAPRLGVERIVLAGASGRTLAFGPGHLDGTALPGTAGTSVVTGHRDTHFRFLRDIAVGDALTVERPDGAVRRYRVRRILVRDRSAVYVDPTDPAPRLMLVTCYPFDAVRPGTPLRYVVIAEADPRP